MAIEFGRKLMVQLVEGVCQTMRIVSGVPLA